MKYSVYVTISIPLNKCTKLIGMKLFTLVLFVSISVAYVAANEDSLQHLLKGLNPQSKKQVGTLWTLFNFLLDNVAASLCSTIGEKYKACSCVNENSSIAGKVLSSDEISKVTETVKEIFSLL